MKNLFKKKLIKNLLKNKTLKSKEMIIKKPIPESYLKTNNNTKPYIIKPLSQLIEKSQFVNEDTKIIKGLFPNEEPIPVSPVLRPIKIHKPQTGKKYLWCSCGMSEQQPYCDGSHKMTAFKPVSFTFEEPVEWAFYCGCKLSNDKPFCDGKTCLEIQGIDIENN